MPRKPAKPTPPDDWNKINNQYRKRPQRLITMSPEGWAELDRRRGDTPVGRYWEQVMGVVA